jgi:hypothetical protein
MTVTRGMPTHDAMDARYTAPPMTDSGLNRAIARGVAYLESVQLPNGEFRAYIWRDPDIVEPILDPSVFTTALIAGCIAPIPGAEKIHARALDFLEAQMEPCGVWRHWTKEYVRHVDAPPDIDDTAVASMALVNAGRAIPDNRELLLANRHDNGHLLTWFIPRRRLRRNPAWWRVTLAQLRHPIKLYFFFTRTPSTPGDIDAVANANVLHYLGETEATRPIIALILDVLRDDRELSCDKWYDDPFVIWYFFSRALREIVPGAGELIVRKLAAATPETPLQHALAACTLAFWNRPRDTAIENVLASQLESGAWPRSSFYHGGRVQWGSEELSTAFCLEALSRP